MKEKITTHLYNGKWSHKAILVGSGKYRDHLKVMDHLSENIIESGVTSFSIKNNRSFGTGFFRPTFTLFFNDRSVTSLLKNKFNSRITDLWTPVNDRQVEEMNNGNVVFKKNLFFKKYSTRIIIHRTVYDHYTNNGGYLIGEVQQYRGKMTIGSTQVSIYFIEPGHAMLFRLAHNDLISSIERVKLFSDL